jgi:hypothetical protein
VNVREVEGAVHEAPVGVCGYGNVEVAVPRATEPETITFQMEG